MNEFSPWLCFLSLLNDPLEIQAHLFISPWMKIRYNLEIPKVYFLLLIATQAWWKIFPIFIMYESF